MPLRLYYRPSFKRSLKRLGHEQRKIAGLILESLAGYYSNGCNLQEAQKIAPRFFYKQLRKPYYEAGVEGNIRVVISREGENCIAVLAGNHDQIKQFLDSV
ncbi:MAG: hypothetical protein Q7J72_08975 [Candidatus Omnitrophota bacterium]|nr:hypothetical protein [Candidatus Omnitrophota bacterium]